MKFAICIPVHNGQTYLRSAILSAVAQSRPADEILVMDDASTDNSAAIANSDEWGGKVRYVYNAQPSGWADAFNRIARLANGDFVTILGCDDLLNKDFLFHVERALKGNRSSRFCYTGQTYIDAHGELVGVSPAPHSTRADLYDGKSYAQNYIRGVFLGKHIHRFAGVAVERRLLINDCPIRREAGLIADDDLFMRIGGLTSVVGVSAPLASVRCHTASITGRLESLSLQLAEDYVFQIRSSKTRGSVTAQYSEIYQVLALRFVNSLLFEGLRAGRVGWVKKAIVLRCTLENEFSENVKRKLTVKEKWIWRVVGDGEGRHVNLFLRAVILLRNWRGNFRKHYHFN